jgi:hypothetical protein
MTPLNIPKDKIAQKAFEIYKNRGEKPGKDLDDWLQAEKELLKKMNPAPQPQNGKNKIRQLSPA